MEAVRALVAKRPALLHEPVLIRESNWGPPLSYAANLGRDAIIRALKKGDRALSVIAEVYSEAMEDWRKAARKWPFAE